jgi:hypothetical protein
MPKTPKVPKIPKAKRNKAAPAPDPVLTPDQEQSLAEMQADARAEREAEEARDAEKAAEKATEDTPAAAPKDESKIPVAMRHRHNMALRYMVKMLLIDIHREWRRSLGLSVRPPYSEEKLGMPPHGGASTAA